MANFNFRNSVVELVSVALLTLIVGLSVGALWWSTAISSPDRVSLVSSFGGVILGATIGAFVSLLVARQASLDARLRDLNAHRLEQRANALRLLVKASLVLSDVTAIRRAIDESLEEANRRQLTNLPMWQRIMPMIGGHVAYEIDSAELAPLIEAGQAELVQDAIEMLMQHRTLIEAVEDYSAKRQKIKEIIEAHHIENDTIIVSSLTKEDKSRLLPYGLELESLITTIRQRLPNLEAQARHVASSIGPAMAKHFDDPTFPQLQPVEGG